MADAQPWRLMGGLGVENEVGQQVITQGIGFPLRPVEGVPTEQLPPIADGSVASTTNMQWAGDWVNGQIYGAGFVTVDGYFQMIANKPTLDKPAPVPSEAPTQAPAGDPAFVTQNDVAQVRSGHIYTFTTSGWARAIQVWVPTVTVDYAFRLIVIATPPGGAPVTTIQELSNSSLTAGAWTTVTLANSIFIDGATLQITLETTNAGSTTQVTGGWGYTGVSQSAAPPAQAWNRDNQHLFVRIDKTDLDGTDRTAELLGITIGSTIQFVQTDNTLKSLDYRVEGSPIDFPAYVQYITSLIGAGPAGGPDILSVTTMTADVPVPAGTDYVDLAAVWPAGFPTWGTVVPTLQFDGVDQSPAADIAYGVALTFEPAAVSPDWDLLAYFGD